MNGYDKNVNIHGNQSEFINIDQITVTQIHGKIPLMPKMKRVMHGNFFASISTHENIICQTKIVAN